MSLRLGFDIDGVLADFDAAFERACQESTGSGERTADEMDAAELRRVWRMIRQTQNWWTTLDAYEPEGIARLYRMSRERKWEVFFLTKRPKTDGDAVQYQTQWWIEQHGFYLPSVTTVHGSRGEVANALRLDLAVDDRLVECDDIIGASVSKALLMLRDTSDQNLADQATARGIGVVSTLSEALDVIEGLEALVSKRGSLARLTDWFSQAKEPQPVLPMHPREATPLPAPSDEPADDDPS